MTNPTNIYTHPSDPTAKTDLIATATPEQQARVNAAEKLPQDTNVYLIHRYTKNRNAWFLAFGATPFEAMRYNVGQKLLWRADTDESPKPTPTIDDMLNASGY